MCEHFHDHLYVGLSQQLLTKIVSSGEGVRLVLTIPGGDYKMPSVYMPLLSEFQTQGNH